MGFGHRVYRAEDPRAGHMRDRSEVLSKKKGQPQWFQILAHLEREVMRPYQAKGIYVNVDFYAGSIYYLLGIPDDLFRADIRHGPHPRLDASVHGAVRRQHPDPPPDGVHWPHGLGIHPPRRTRLAYWGFILL